MSTSECFCNNNLSYAPIAQLLTKDDYSLKNLLAVNRHMELFGTDNYRKQFLLDYIIYNYDRHLNNFGVYYNPDTKEILGPAKIYDNGVGLFTYGTGEDYTLEGMEKYMFRRDHPTDFSFDFLLEYLLNDEMKELARSLVNYELQEHDLYKVPEWRLEGMNRLIQNRVQNILNYKHKNNIKIYDKYMESKKIKDLFSIPKVTF